MSKPKETVTTERLIQIGKEVRVAASHVVHEFRKYNENDAEVYPNQQFWDFLQKLADKLEETHVEQWLPIASVPNEPKPTKPSRGSRSRPSSTGDAKVEAGAAESPLPGSTTVGTSSCSSPPATGP